MLNDVYANKTASEMTAGLNTSEVFGKFATPRYDVNRPQTGEEMQKSPNTSIGQIKITEIGTQQSIPKRGQSSNLKF